MIFFKPSLKYFLLGTVLFFVLIGLLTVFVAVRAQLYPPYKAETQDFPHPSEYKTNPKRW